MQTDPSTTVGGTPPVFVVNLAGATERRKGIEAQLRFLDLDYEIIEAVDGKALTPEQEAQVDRAGAERRLGEPLLPGEVGCALSHQKVYQRMLELGLDNAIVLEDDALLGDGFLSVVRALTRSPEDLVLLHHCYSFSYPWSRKRRPFAPDHRLLPCTRTPCSTVAYYLTSKAASKLVTGGSPIRGRADWPLPIDRDLQSKLVYPAVAFHDPRYDTDVRERDYPTSNRFIQYLESLTFVPYLKDRDSHDSLASYIAGYLLSVPIYHAPPRPRRLALLGADENATGGSRLHEQG